MDNKFPGKDISLEDLKSKFPLAAKKNKNHKSKLRIAGVEFGGSKIPIFAGPNMVESKSLILDVAKNVKKIGADFLRGGAFKPLTFPYRSKKYNETRTKNHTGKNTKVVFINLYKVCFFSSSFKFGKYFSTY